MLSTKYKHWQDFFFVAQFFFSLLLLNSSMMVMVWLFFKSVGQEKQTTINLLQKQSNDLNYSMQLFPEIISLHCMFNIKRY